MVAQEDKKSGPDFYEVGKHEYARKKVRQIKNYEARGEAYLLLQEIIGIDSVLIRHKIPADGKIHSSWRGALEDRTKAAQRLEKILNEHTKEKEWNESRGEKYFTVDQSNGYDFVYSVFEVNQVGRRVPVATFKAVYELDQYRIVCTSGKDYATYKDIYTKPSECREALSLLVDAAIGKLNSAGKMFKNDKPLAFLEGIAWQRAG